MKGEPDTRSLTPNSAIKTHFVGSRGLQGERRQLHGLPDDELMMRSEVEGNRGPGGQLAHQVPVEDYEGEGDCEGEVTWS